MNNISDIFPIILFPFIILTIGYLGLRIFNKLYEYPRFKNFSRAMFSFIISIFICSIIYIVICTIFSIENTENYTIQNIISLSIFIASIFLARKINKNLL